MSSNTTAVLEKVRNDRRRSNYKKALSRLDGGIKKSPSEILLYIEGIDLAMEAGESLKALQYIKTAQQRLPDRRFEIWSVAAEKTGTYNDPIVGKFLIELAVRTDDLTAAFSVTNNLKDHTADELLRRIRTKRQTLSTAFGGGLTVGDDLIHNAIGEALLCFRLSHFSDAMNGFVGILDDNPETHRRIEPFIASLEREHRHNGDLSFVLGCCYLASGRFGKAMEKITRAVGLDPSLADSAIQRIESLENDAALPADERRMFLAQLLIGKEQDGRVTRMLKQVLDTSPNRALDVLELLESHVVSLGNNTGLHFVYVDAALLLGRTETVITMLRKIYQAKKHRANLVSWLDQRFRERSVPAEILTFSGEIALKEALYGKAIEIFKEILSYGPQDEPAIKELLLQYRSNSSVDHFLRDRFNEAPIQARAAHAEFETCDGLNFVRPKMPEETENDDPISGAPRSNDRCPEFAADEFTIGSDESSSELGLDNHDFSLGLGDSTASDTEPDEQHPALDDSHSESEPNDGDESDLFSYLQRDIPDEPSYFKDDDTSETADDDDTPESVPPPLEDTDKELITSVTYGTGDTDNQLNRKGYLELAEQALNKGALDEAKEHLNFDPANLAEEIRRKYLLATYYLAAERPIQALVVLRSVQLIGLSRDEQKDFLLRIAECYQRLHNFEAAYSVFLRIMADHPDTEVAEHMAKVNYERYLRRICGEEPVLEKITSL